MPASPTKSRWIPRIAISLCLGAITTVAVAWTLACVNLTGKGATSDQRIRPTRGPVGHQVMGGPADGISVQFFCGAGRVVMWIECYGPDYQQDVGIPGVGMAKEVDVPPDEIIPPWARPLALPWLFDTSWPRGNATDWRKIQGSGWPMIALSSEQRLGTNWTHEQRFGIKVAGSRFIGRIFGRREERVLPLRPRWLGFGADTLLYGGAWFGLLALGRAIPTTIQNHRRQRRGLCPKCGYDTSATAPNLPCPECGKPNSSHSIDPAPARYRNQT